MKPRKGVKYWKEQIELARQQRTTHEKWWDAAMKAYAPSASMAPETYGGDINTNRVFTLVERKKADLFYQRPEVSLQPSPLMDEPLPMPGAPPDPTTGQPAMVPGTVPLQAHEEIVNEKLGPDGVDALKLAHSSIFDLELFGFGWSKMGYESVTVDVQEPDPMDVQHPEVVLGLRKPKMMTVPVPIHEQCFWHHFSPKQALVPHNFRSTDWDRAPWLGFQFELPLTEANRQRYKLPADYKGSKSKEELHFDHGSNQTQASEDVFTGVEIWYRSSLFRDDQPHPEHLTQLVIVDGVDDPVLEQDSPYQTVTEQGELSPDSLIGFPIHPLNTRTLTDSSYPPSDVTMILPLQNELNKFRTQMVEYRDAQVLRWGVNSSVIPREAMLKIARSPISGMVELPGEAFPIENNFVELPHGSMPRESFTSNDYIDNDIARTTAIDASGAGVQSQSNSTATEQQIVAANANARLDFERGVVLQWYTKGVTKFSTLLQRYLPVAQAAQIVGPQRAQVWDAWRKAVPSSLAFTALPDSALRVDQAVDRKQAQDLYTFLFNDPNVNKQELLKGLLRKFHLDPNKIVVPPPPPQPDGSKASVSFKGEDLVAPQAPIVLEMLQQAGWKITPGAVSLSQQALLQAEQMMAAEAAAQEQKGEAEHGGKLPAKEGLSKHAADMTGGMQNTGAPAALGAPGGMIQ